MLEIFPPIYESFTVALLFFLWFYELNSKCVYSFILLEGKICLTFDFYLFTSFFFTLLLPLLGEIRPLVILSF